MCELEQENLNVGDLVHNFGPTRGVVQQLGRVIAMDPSEVIHKLASLNGHGHGQILGVVELPPVTRLAELGHKPLKPKKIVRVRPDHCFAPFPGMVPRRSGKQLSVDEVPKGNGAAVPRFTDPPTNIRAIFMKLIARADY
jgi:hypothetical protein